MTSWFTVMKRALLLALLLPLAASGQGINVEFGKNRVQYHDFTWSFYQSENFVTYYYLGGQEIGKFVAQIAERDLSDIEGVIDYKINTRIEILVYNDVTDLNMSNIGLGLELNNIGGITKIIGNKVFVHFTGDHMELRKQVRQGIAMVLVNNMVFGGSLQEVLQNAVLLNLPDWFVNGLVSYIGERWSEEHDNRMKDGILSGRYRKFNRLEGADAVLAGHSFWYFLEERHGREAIPNLLYLTRINRSLENGFLFVLGYTYTEAINRWYEFFRARYLNEELGRMAWEEEAPLDIRTWPKRTYTTARINPDGQHVAFVTNDIGRWRIHLANVTTGKVKTIKRGGFKTQTLGIDYGYPMLDWDPTGRTLLIFYEKRDLARMATYSMEKGRMEERELIKFQRIVDFRFTGNPNIIVMSAVNRGQTDIYTMDVRSTTTNQLTNDIYDDLQPAYLKLPGNREGIVFTSNRPRPTLEGGKADSVLPVSAFNLFFLNENGNGSDRFVQLTHDNGISHRQPMQADSTHFSFLTADNGIYNRYAGYIDTTFSHNRYIVYYQDSIITYELQEQPEWLLQRDSIIDSVRVRRMVKDTAYTFHITNYNRNIGIHDIRPLRGEVLNMVYHDGAYRFYIHRMPDSLYAGIIPGLANTAWRQRTITDQRKKQTDPEKPKRDPGYLFQSEFDTDDSSEVRFGQQDDPTTFIPTRVQPYRVKFSTDYVMTQVDNTILINQYQNFIGNGPVFQTPAAGGLITLSISDLLEDYRFTGGFRMPTSFAGSEYFIKFEDLKHRLDKQLLVYRRGDMVAYDFRPFHNTEVRARQHLHYAEGSVKYPIDILRSIRGRLGYRNYKISFLSTEPFSLSLPPYTENWLNLTTEYVFDNTNQVMLNILNGTRYRVYYEIHKQFELQLDPAFSFDPGLGTMHVVGGDFRHYQKVHRQIMWANRVAFASSFGSKKLIYYLGGVDNWLMPRFDNNVEVNRNNNYAFQTLATNMRGHWQNVRNGNSYMVWNSELRIPVFTYLFNTPIRSEMIRNFQAIGFTDVGTAWEGRSPFAQDNPFNTETSERGPVRVSTQYFRNPIVAGYGFGARTVLFGYFVRADVSWGLDSGERKGPQWYFSLNLDF